MKFYAVKKGKVKGIYFSWDDCKKMVSGVDGAVYKSFIDINDALKFVIDDPLSLETVDYSNIHDYAFVDGSYNAVTKTYGYGVLLMNGNTKHILQGSDNNPEYVENRNIAGEVLGAEAAAKLAIDLGIKTLYIFYDYQGIEMWAKGIWQRNKLLTQTYYENMQEYMKKVNLYFVKVKGHAGIEGNEIVDKLAKEAVGIS